MKKIIVVSDMHKTDEAAKVFFNAIRDNNPDLVILNGDILDFYRYNEIDNLRYMSFLISFLENRKQKWKYILGNHDIDMYLYFSGDKFFSKYINNVCFEYNIGDYVFLHGHQSEKEEYDTDSSWWKLFIVRLYSKYLESKNPEIGEKINEIADYVLNRRPFKGKTDITKWVDTVFENKKVVLGHTHLYQNGIKTEKNIYYNSGYAIVGDYLLLDI